MTFDYASAWREVAKPAYQNLPPAVLGLFAHVAVVAADLHQQADLTMPWPDGLRMKFTAIDTDQLALASQVIHDCGHWYPSDGDLDMPGRKAGAHWKFSNYADQVLRERLKIAGETPFQVHEGAIRLCYSSRDMWTWAEVAPATPEGLEKARALCSERPGAPPNRPRASADSAVWQWYEKLRTRDLGWPENWKPLVNVADRYMRDEQEIKAAHKPTGKDIKAVVEDCNKTIREATHERDGLVWLLEHGLHIDNVIDYHHENGGEGLFCFGWKEPVIDSVRDAILAVISEFPFAYRIKCVGGKVLEGDRHTAKAEAGV